MNHKKHRINGYSWISIDNSNYENQYYTVPPVKIIKTIHDRTDSNVDQRVLNMTPMGDFSLLIHIKKINSLLTINLISLKIYHLVYNH